jgi:hypothetical protein
MENRNKSWSESMNSFIRSFMSIGSSMSSNGMPLSKIDGRVGATTVELLAAPCSIGSCAVAAGSLSHGYSISKHASNKKLR